MHRKIVTCLKYSLDTNHPTQAHLYNQLMALTDDLRTLNMLHQEKLRACKLMAQVCTVDMPANKYSCVILRIFTASCACQCQ